MDSAQTIPADPVDLWFHAVGGRCGEMIIEMELAFECRLDEQCLALALDLLFETEPVLGCRLVVDAQPPRWQPVRRQDRRPLAVTPRLGEYERVRRTGLDTTTNVQVALCVWRGDTGDHLLAKMTHAVGDGAALQSLVARLASIYSALCADPAYRPARVREGRRCVEHVLSEVPRRVYPRVVWDLLRFMAPRWFPRSTHVLALPHESAGTWVPVLARVPAGVTFLSAYAKTRGATLNDVFLAAAYRALALHGPWDGASGLRIAITVDLRRWCLPPEYAGSIRNLSSLEYPFLIRDLGARFEDTLANVSALTRRRKTSRPGLASALIGHYLMKRAGHERLLREARSRPRRPVSGSRTRKTIWHTASAVLSNEGPLDSVGLRFGVAHPVSAHMLPPFLALPGVQLCVSSYHGALTFAAVTPQNGHATIERYVQALVEQLPKPPGVLTPDQPGSV